MVAVSLALQLDAMCRKIERIFPGTICAWGGFSQPREPTEDEDIVVEVFFAPGGSSRSITRATHEDARGLWREHEVSVAVVAHYVDDTLRYYLGDVLETLSTCGATHVLDPGGFCEATAPAGQVSGGALSWGIRGMSGTVIDTRGCASRQIASLIGDKGAVAWYRQDSSIEVGGVKV